jgi:uncharacterized repeat protein (TIGR01451 family)
VRTRGPRVAAAGRLATHRITVRNAGRRPDRVVVGDVLPRGVALVRRVRGATLRRGLVTWSIGAPAPGGSRTVALRVGLVELGRRCTAAVARAGNAAAARDRGCTRIRRTACATRLPVTG